MNEKHIHLYAKDGWCHEFVVVTLDVLKFLSPWQFINKKNTKNLEQSSLLAIICAVLLLFFTACQEPLTSNLQIVLNLAEAHTNCENDNK